MGDPVTLGAMAVSSIAGTGASLFGQAANAKAMEEAQRKQNEMITKATIDNYKELSKAEQAIAYNTAQDSLQNQINELNALGQAEAMASATGARGGSVDMAFLNINQQADRVATGLNMARDEALQQVDQQAKALQQGAQLSYSNQVIEKPSIVKALGTGISMGSQVQGFTGDFMKTFRNFRQIK